MYNNNRYLRNDPLLEWANPEHADRDPMPAKLMKFLELYDDGSIEFGYDPYDKAQELIEMVQDDHDGLDLDELASIAIANSF
jgi:hypothetical protein